MGQGTDRIPVEGAAESRAGEALDQRFIAVRPEDLACAIGEDAEAFGPASGRAEELLEAIRAVVELEMLALRRELERRYAPFNPDRDTVEVRDQAGSAPERLGELRGALRYVFEKANFIRLTDVQIEDALSAANSAGLRVRLDPEAVESLDLFVRGTGSVERRLRHWRAPIRGRLVRLDVYRRLGVIVRLKDAEHMLLKLYRDIPIADIEALLPHAQVAMGWVDRAKVAFGGAGALGGVAAKIVKGGVLLSPASMAVPAAVALGGLSVKSFLGYKRAKRLRVSQRTHHLYNLTLASNASVVQALLGLVGAQEINEALLLYAALAGDGGGGSDAGTRDLEAVDGWIEGWLGRRLGMEVDFDMDDAVETLDRLGLWSDRDGLGVLEPEAACARLRAHVLDRHTRGYHLDCAGIAGARR